MAEVMQMGATRGSAGGQGALKDGPSVQGPVDPVPSAGRGDLWVLGPEECFALLEPGGVGRVGFTSADGVMMLPVNFAMTGKTIVFRTGPDTLLAAYGDAMVSFEADSLDEARREGWSVMVQGHAHKVAGEQEVRRLERATCLEPWAGGARDVYVRITPAQITGRRIRHAGLHPPAG